MHSSDVIAGKWIRRPVNNGIDNRFRLVVCWFLFLLLFVFLYLYFIISVPIFFACSVNCSMEHLKALGDWKCWNLNRGRFVFSSSVRIKMLWCGKNYYTLSINSVDFFSFFFLFVYLTSFLRFEVHLSVRLLEG